eukprot:CAMPEP_0176147528 /NCGR_PEP_ID=MMETSP0120_2-20121206/75207_1 /TAXON_ID=160619 /ORGANISM="Kryptoperidinium foliaceum, Strain CCMP 1326" /LENGTH=643 /DNA_ID=CAMNT_0017484147 /DNA_START=91 /DNA_END=2022 /DNA_ORIENTATION=-
MACELSFEASLAAMAAAYKALEAENLRLQEELRTMMATESQSAHAQALAQAHPHAKDMCASEHSKNHFGRVFQADDQALLNEKRNAKAADLMQLIADIDPEEQGAWASASLEPVEVFEMLKSTDLGCTMLEAEELVEKFRVYCNAQEPKIETPTKFKLVTLTNIEDLGGIFGSDSVLQVMEVQNAIADQFSMLLLAERKSARHSIRFRTADDFTPTMLKEDWHILVRETKTFDMVDMVGTILVALNTLMLGLSADVTPGWNGWDYISATFAVLFVIELVAKIVLSGGLKTYYLGSNRDWRKFDTIVILLALSDIAVLAVLSDGVDGRAVTLIRIVRLVRLTRITRLGQTGIFHELAYMIRGIEAGTSTLAWAVVLLVIVCYVGAIILTQTVGRNPSSEVFRPYAEKHFANVTLSMFTLFRCFTGDCAAYDGIPLSYALHEEYGRISIAVYWVMIMTVTFGLFNVMVANLLQNSQRASRFSDAERRRFLRKERKMVHEKTQTLMKRIREICGDSDTTDLELSREDFRQLLKDKEVAMWLDNLGCDDGLRGRLFDKIDRDGNGVLSAQELVAGIVDLVRGRFDNMENITLMLRTIQKRLVQMEGALALRHKNNGMDRGSSIARSCDLAAGNSATGSAFRRSGLAL